MTRGHRKWGTLVAAGALLVGGGVLFATVSIVRVRHRQSETQPNIHFPVPASDKITAATGSSTHNAEGQWMTLDPSGKFLINSRTHKPVFITGEAAWSLQAQLSDAEIELYLSDRAARGFNLIMVDLAENFYSNHPPKDFYGNVPFDGADFTNPNEAYWSRVDRTFRRAEAYGITVLADPAFVGFDCTGGYCPSYRSSSTATLTAFGQYLGNRYKSFPNVIWLIGGDADPADSDGQSRLYALAKGIRTADLVHLMTTESLRGTSSIEVWSGAPWLDLDGLYVKAEEIPAKAYSDYKTGTYPMFLLEDWYEGAKTVTELGVRKEGYWAVLSGCTLGRIFGNYAIWDFTWTQETKDPWQGQLGSAGSVGQKWLGKLFRSREHWKLIPDIDHSVMTAGYDSRPLLSSAKESVRSWVYQEPLRTGDMLAVTARTSDGQTIIAYIPNGNATTVAIDMSEITDSHSQAKGWWYNPRDGSTTLMGSIAASGTRKFRAPDANDWVLVIDSQDANLAPPGSKDL